MSKEGNVQHYYLTPSPSKHELPLFPTLCLLWVFGIVLEYQLQPIWKKKKQKFFHTKCPLGKQYLWVSCGRFKSWPGPWQQLSPVLWDDARLHMLHVFPSAKAGVLNLAAVGVGSPSPLWNICKMGMWTHIISLGRCFVCLRQIIERVSCSVFQSFD